jgi:hypothetical protein
VCDEILAVEVKERPGSKSYSYSICILFLFSVLYLGVLPQTDLCCNRDGLGTVFASISSILFGTEW